VPRRHLDLEGHELPTLSGARQLLQRDKPLLSYEVAVHRHQAHTKALLGYIDSLGSSSTNRAEWSEASLAPHPLP